MKFLSPKKPRKTGKEPKKERCRSENNSPSYYPSQHQHNNNIINFSVLIKGSTLESDRDVKGHYNKALNVEIKYINGIDCHLIILKEL